MRIDGVDDGRLLGDDVGEAAGRDDPRANVRISIANPRDDRLGLSGEAVDDAALQRLDRVASDRAAGRLERDLRQLRRPADQARRSRR